MGLESSWSNSTVKKRHPGPAKKPKDAAVQAPEVQIESSGSVVVEHHPAPPTSQPDHRIHARLPLPLVPNAPPEKKEDKEKEALKNKR